MKRSKLLLSLLALNAWGNPELEALYLQAHEQALERDYITFRARPLLSHEAYQSLKENRESPPAGALVIVRGNLERFIYLSEWGGVAVSSDTGAHLRFDIRYFETLQDIGIGGRFFALCVLPRYDKCLLLGYKAF